MQKFCSGTSLCVHGHFYPPYDAVPDVNGVKARLDFAEYLGDSVKLHMDLGGTPFMAKVPEDRYTEIRGFEGKDVTASWSREDGHLLEQ